MSLDTKILAAAAITAALATLAPPATVDAQAAAPAAATRYKNCAALNKVYPHGVGKSGAKDKIKGKTGNAKAVANFKRSNSLYAANKHLDRDKDGVACEKR
ncbi:MAG: excalibur calcium-binding domain-containing protein [Propionibacteriaceae bacterium]|jgi:hypothetical protein|nr:excalibur calcium-binding domain-containing protein [Propionibacteriaceae bacterium]